MTPERMIDLLEYNQDTGDFTWRHNVAKNVKAGRKAGYRRSNGYIVITIQGRCYFAHRLAWLFIYGEWPTQIDHVNHDRADNRICNLREVSTSVNGKNRRLGNNNSTGIIGVYKIKNSGRWQAAITINNKLKGLGRFDDFFEACCARKSAERKHGYHYNHGSIK